MIKYGIAAAILAGGAVAGATTLPAFANSGVLQSGNSEKASCQTSELSVQYTPDTLGNYLKTVTVNGIDKACGGKYITVKPVDAQGNAMHASTGGPTDFTQVPADGGSVALSTFNNTYIKQVDHVVITFSDYPPSQKLY